MRKIDSSAYNKRLHAEILELEKMVKDINPENINLFDSTLISTAEKYISLIGNSAWSNNSNFNGIEMNKLQGMLNRLKTFRNKLYVGRDIVLVQREGDNNYRLTHEIVAPKNFDARQSIVIPRSTVQGINHITYSKKLESSVSNYSEKKFVVYKQQQKITIEYEVTISKSASYSSNIVLTFLYIMWR